MSSKIPETKLREAIRKVLNPAKKREFVETIDLQIGLRNYDPSKDTKFNQTLRLPYNPCPKRKVCLIGDEYHVAKAQELGITAVTIKVLEEFKKDKVLIKKWVAKHDAYLVSDSLVKTIPRVLGPALVRRGKFPVPVSRNDDLAARVIDVQSTIRFQLKKVVCFGVPIGHLEMTEDEVYRNLNQAINCLVSILKKRWQSVGTLYMCSTMGKPVRLY